MKIYICIKYNFLTCQNLAYCDGHLLVYSDTHLDIFNTQTGEWVQSIGLKKSRPLSFNGNLTSMVINDIPYVIYLANMHTRELLNTTNFERENRIKPKRRFSFREINKSTIRIGSDRRKLISAPTNFNHISHVGPDIQKQKLFDLPTTVDTIDQPASVSQKMATMRSVSAPRTPPRSINLSLNNKKPPIPARYPSSLPRSPSPLDSSVSSIHETLKSQSDRKSGSRQSVTSNNSSCSTPTPPSPVTHPDRLSSS